MSYDIHRKRRATRPSGERQSQNPYASSGSCGDKPRGKFQKGCIGALAMCIIVPLLTLFTFLAIIGMIAKVIPELVEHVTK